MALLTKLDDGSIEALGREFGLAVVGHDHIAGGVENTSFLVASHQGEFVLTILERRTLESAVAYATFLESLAGAGVPTPPPRRRPAGGYVVEWGRKPVIAAGLVAGDHADDLPPDRLLELGRILARLHGLRIGAEPAVVASGAEPFDRAWRHTDPAFAEWALRRHEQSRHVTERGDPLVPIHGDPFPDNVIVEPNGDLVLIDWEDGGLGPALLDVGLAIVGFCGNGDSAPARAQRLLAGYRESRALDGDPLDVLHATVYAGVLVACQRFARGGAHGLIQSRVDRLIAAWTAEGWQSA